MGVVSFGGIWSCLSGEAVSGGGVCGPEFWGCMTLGVVLLRGMHWVVPLGREQIGGPVSGCFGGGGHVSGGAGQSREVLLALGAVLSPTLLPSSVSCVPPRPSRWVLRAAPAAGNCPRAPTGRGGGKPKATGATSSHALALRRRCRGRHAARPRRARGFGRAPAPAPGTSSEAASEGFFFG